CLFPLHLLSEIFLIPFVIHKVFFRFLFYPSSSTPFRMFVLLIILYTMLFTLSTLFVLKKSIFLSTFCILNYIIHHAFCVVNTFLKFFLSQICQFFCVKVLTYTETYHIIKLKRMVRKQTKGGNEND